MRISFASDLFTMALSSVFLLLLGTDLAFGGELRILEPKDGAELRLSASENMPAERAIRGDIGGFTNKQIEELKLRVKVSIQTDKWYLQGIAAVRPDGTWRLRKGYFGGAKHLIKAVLKDQNGNELASATARVILIQ